MSPARNTCPLPGRRGTTPRAVAGEVERLTGLATDALRRHPSRAVDLAQQAVDLARQHRHSTVLAGALRALGNAELLCGDYSAALPVLLEGLEAARRARQREHEIACLNGVGVALMRLGDFEGAVEHLRLALALTGDHGDRPARMTMHANLANVCAELENFEAAVEHGRQAVAALAGEGIDATVPDSARVAQMNYGAYLARVGRVAEAVGQLQAAQAAMRRTDDRTGEARVLAILGETELDRGRLDAAAIYLVDALALSRESQAVATEASVLLLLGRVHSLRGADEVALPQLQQALHLAQKTGEVRTQRLVHNALADVHERRGDLRQALDEQRAAYQVERSHYMNLAQARAQALLARMRLAEAQREAHAQRAHNLELMEANRRIAARNVGGEGRVRPAAVLKDYDLSERELRVLVQVGRGATNPQIAQTLGLSPYTVRDHVSSILSKLEVATRTEAAAVAMKNGWL